jgi:hypothetical protein
MFICISIVKRYLTLRGTPFRSICPFNTRDTSLSVTYNTSADDTGPIDTYAILPPPRGPEEKCGPCDVGTIPIRLGRSDMRVLGIMSLYALGIYLKLDARSFVLDWFHFHSYIYICAGLKIHSSCGFEFIVGPT